MHCLCLSRPLLDGRETAKAAETREGKHGEYCDQSQASILTINQSQASKISFDDTMDIDRSHARCHALEPDSSDEDEARERYR